MMTETRMEKEDMNWEEVLEEDSGLDVDSVVERMG
jgi:hypothetical protein